MIPVCPRCDCALVTMAWKDLEVDACPSCHGLWLDAGELEALLGRTGGRGNDPMVAAVRSGKERKPEGAQARLCPRCDRKLVGVEVVGSEGGKPIVVDRCCRGHGLWLDAGELRQLLEAFPAESRTSAAVAELGDLLGPAGTASPVAPL